VSVPVKNSFSQAGSGRNYRDIFFRMINPAIKEKKILRFEVLQAARGGHQIVHQHDALARQTQTGGERSGIKCPRHMRGVQPAIDYRAGNAETCALDIVAVR
jgi:hypothetical protein